MFDETIVCFHIPKTAGTSLVAEIGRLNVPWAHVAGGVYSPEHAMVIGDGRDFLRVRRREAMSGTFRVMIGHFTQRNVLAAYGRQPRFRFATILREPVDRLHSEYRYVTLSPAQPDRADYAARYPTFESFVDENVDGNVMTHFLEEYRGEPVSRIVDRLLDSYAFVGTVATYDEDVARFRALFGAGRKTPFHLNVSPPATAAVSEPTLARIRERNARDVELYDAFMARRVDRARPRLEAVFAN